MSIFIPKQIKVGYQERKDTFTGKLSYVIYYDSFGKLRKETSWESWRNKEIDPTELENTPMSGFFLNKGIRRFNWGHFGSNRSMIRIHDPRGFEFEITPENLIGLLMHTDCCKREVQGDLVYAWNRGELMLIPTSSEEYQDAKKFTELQAKKVSAKELIEGATYITKQEDKCVYLGRHMHYECMDHYSKPRRVGKKQHMFIDIDGKQKPYPIKSVSSKLGAVINEHPHERTAEWIKNYTENNIDAQKVVGLAVKPTKNRQPSTRGTSEYKLDAKGIATGYTIEFGARVTNNWHRHSTTNGPERWYSTLGSYIVNPDGSPEDTGRCGWGSDREHDLTDKELGEFGQLYAKLENGKLVKWG